jgi:DNA-binding XRE family transcriptional regulator
MPLIARKFSFFINKDGCTNVHRTQDDSQLKAYMRRLRDLTLRCSNSSKTSPWSALNSFSAPIGVFILKNLAKKLKFYIIIPMKALKPSKTSLQIVKIRTSSPALPLPLPVGRALIKLGSDVSLARRRRHISQASLAERIGASVSTIRRMEQGDLRVPIHFFARTMQVFGVLDGLSQLIDTAQDDIGLTMMDERLPQRVRSKRKPSSTPGAL